MSDKWVNLGSCGCTASLLVWSQLTIATSSCFEAHGIQRFHSQEYHIVPIKNEEIYGIVSHLSFPMSFFSMWDTGVWGTICVKIQNFINLNLHAWKLTGIYEFTIHDTDIYRWYWYLYIILVFTHHTGIYVSFWYLHIILVFKHHTEIYIWYWYLCAIQLFTCMWYWYFTHGTVLHDI